MTDAAGGVGSSVERSRYYIDGAFIVEHRPARGALRPTGLLLLPPLGYEDTSAYRSLRHLADALARAGHLVLRLDWPGLGDSGASAREAGLVDRWLGAASDAARSLQQRGLPKVGVIGVRAGALLGLGLSGIDSLVAWGLPVSGRHYLRGEKAFHKMAEAVFGETPADRPPLPEGAVEAGGFYFGPQTVADLGRMEAAALAAQARLRRVLLIPREGSAPPVGLVQAFAGADTAVEVAELGGIGPLLENPYQSVLLPEVGAAIHAFFDEPARPGLHLSAPPAAPQLLLPGGCTERPWRAVGGAGELSGILCIPPGGIQEDHAWTLFLNAGGIRRSGPNRLWTEAARALAAEGRPSLRFDMRDVGDSDGAVEPHADLEAMYSEAPVHDARLAHDALQDLGAGSVDVVGLCSGAFLGARLAAERPVRRALLFNGLVFVWDEDARASSMTAHIRASLFNGRRWRRLLTGRISAVALARAIGKKGLVEARSLVARARGEAAVSDVERLLCAVMDSGCDLHLVSSEGDPSIDYLHRQVRADRRPSLTIVPGVDHTLRPLWSHSRVIALIQGGVDPKQASSPSDSPRSIQEP